MRIVLMQQFEFDLLWNKSNPEGRGRLEGLPTPHIFFYPQNTLILLNSETTVLAFPNTKDANDFTMGKFFGWLWQYMA